MMLLKRHTKASGPSGSPSRCSKRTKKGKKPENFGSFVEQHPRELPQRCLIQRRLEMECQKDTNLHPSNVNVIAAEESHHADINNQHNNVNAPVEEKDTAGDDGTIDDDGSDDDDDNRIKDSSGDDIEEPEDVGPL